VVKSMLVGQSPILADNAAVKRDLIHIDDAVHATLLAASAVRVSGQVYNVASGRPANLLDVVATVNDIIGANIQPIFKGSQLMPASPSLVSITRAETELGFCPGVDLKQGLRSLIEFYAQQGGFPLAEKVSAARRGRGPHVRAARPAKALEPNEPESPQPT